VIRRSERAVVDIKVYGASWCPDCRRAKQFLDEQRMPYDWIDLDVRPEMRSIVQERNAGATIIPTIVFADGSHLADERGAGHEARPSRKRRSTIYDLVIVGAGGRRQVSRNNGPRANVGSLAIPSAV
jgi:glutaredoxin